VFHILLTVQSDCVPQQFELTGLINYKWRVFMNYKMSSCTRTVHVFIL